MMGRIGHWFALELNYSYSNKGQPMIKYAKVNLNNEVEWLDGVDGAAWLVMKKDDLTLVSLICDRDYELSLSIVTKMQNLDHAVILANETLYMMGQANE